MESQKVNENCGPIELKEVDDPFLLMLDEKLDEVQNDFCVELENKDKALNQYLLEISNKKDSLKNYNLESIKYKAQISFSGLLSQEFSRNGNFCGRKWKVLNDEKLISDLKKTGALIYRKSVLSAIYYKSERNDFEMLFGRNKYKDILRKRLCKRIKRVNKSIKLMR